jgi:hypothetical protein
VVRGEPQLVYVGSFSDGVGARPARDVVVVTRGARIEDAMLNSCGSPDRLLVIKICTLLADGRPEPPTPDRASPSRR